MNLPPMKLSDDPKEALREIAGYLRSVRTDNGRKHYEKRGPEGLGREFVGYWQTEDWFTGLAEIMAEAERVGGLP